MLGSVFINDARDREIAAVMDGISKAAGDAALGGPEWMDMLQASLAVVLSVNDVAGFSHGRQRVRESIKSLGSISRASHMKGNPFGVRMPDMHDFYVLLARKFTWESFQSFFRPWAESIAVFAWSRGACWPRLLPSVEGHGWVECCLVTEGLLDRLGAGIGGLELNRYYMYGGGRIGELDEYREAYMKVFGDEWEEPFDRFLNGEYRLMKLLDGIELEQEAVMLMGGDERHVQWDGSSMCIPVR